MTATAETAEVASFGDAFDVIDLTTVGIDIGSTTSHALFGRLRLRRLSQSLSSRYVVVDRQVLGESPVTLTPFQPNGLIDVEKLRRVFDEAYRECGLSPDDIDTGAVILTGVALERANAAAVAEMFSSAGGRFVCASAGHRLEGMLAAHGSGAVAHSAKNGIRAIHVDVGGGTSKISLIDSGEIQQTVAVQVGARLVSFDEDDRLDRIEPAAHEIATSCGFELVHGQSVTSDDRNAFVQRLGDVLVDVVTGTSGDTLAEKLMLTDSAEPVDLATYTEISFSGGVSEYMHDRGASSVGDLGGELAAEILKRTRVLSVPVRVVDRGVRATVLGAAQFTAQVSGNTIYVSDPTLLPQRNLPVVQPRPADWQDSAAALTEAIAVGIDRLSLDSTSSELAIALGWQGSPDHASLHRLATAVADATGASSSRTASLAVAIRQDVARSLGRILADELGVTCPLIVLDSVELYELDFIDVGEVLEPAGVVSVVVKSLAFPHAHG